MDEAYDHLVELDAKDPSLLLRFMKEALPLDGDKRSLENVDHHMAGDVPRHHLILSVTQSAPKDPFAGIVGKFNSKRLPRLIAVHIQVHDLKSRKNDGEQRHEQTWLSWLFAS